MPPIPRAIKKYTPGVSIPAGVGGCGYLSGSGAVEVSSWRPGGLILWRWRLHRPTPLRCPGGVVVSSWGGYLSGSGRGCVYRYQPTPLRSLDLGGGRIGQRRCIFPAGVGIQPGRRRCPGGIWARGSIPAPLAGLYSGGGAGVQLAPLRCPGGAGTRLDLGAVPTSANGVAVPWRARLVPGRALWIWAPGRRLNPAAGWDIVKRSARRRAKFCGALRLFSFSLSL